MRAMASPVFNRSLKIKNFYKCTIRNISKNVRNIRDRTFAESEEHVYKKLLFKNNVLNEIVDSVVHRSDDLIVVNKPYGVGMLRNTKQLENYIPQTFTDVCMEDILPELAERLGQTSLWVAKAPERFASGVMILVNKEENVIKVQKGFSSYREMPYKYLVVTVGQPVKESCEAKYGIKCANGDKQHIPMVLDKWSKNSLKRRELFPTKWKHKVLSQSELSSLVQVEIGKPRKNSLRLILATKFLSPILGDQIFSCRTTNLMGVPVLVNPKVGPTVSYTLNPQLLKQLNLQGSEIKIIPAHVHLHSVVFILQKKFETTFCVPPPESFIWTCKQLHLNLDEQGVKVPLIS